MDHTRNHGADRRFWSAALCEKRDLYVYLPPGFDPTRCYPVLIFLHGIIQDERVFIQYGLNQLDAAMALGKMPPTIIAMPDGSLRGWEGPLTAQPLFVNSKLGRFEDFVVQDVWNFLREHYPIRPERQAHVLMGFSGGGAAAYRMAMKYRDQFSTAVGIAAPLNLRWIDCHGRYFTHFDPNCWGWRTEIKGYEVVGRFYGVVIIRLGQLIFPLYGRGPEAVAAVSRENPIEMLDSYNVCPGELAMYIAYGGKDEFNIGAHSESFLFVAHRRGLQVEVDFDPDAVHDRSAIEKFLPRIISWLTPQLAPFAPPPMSAEK
jgi:S-formylglutathione hydrolase FrmB